MNLVKQQEIFAAALEIEDEGRRLAMVDHACGGDPELRARVAELLADHARAEQFMSDCTSVIIASADDPGAPGGLEAAGLSDREKEADDAVGTRIGPYKLLQKIGEGGCGVVYMAEQEKPVRRRVALKIIKLGMDTRNVIARFEAERQALALMNHPNIARVLDAAATESGRPYFVMELVHGVRITEYCDEHSSFSSRSVRPSSTRTRRASSIGTSSPRTFL
jgi:serine/threonine protein kinase